MTDFSILWHLALCGLTGSGMAQIADATHLNYNTVSTALNRLLTDKLVTEAKLRDKPGHPLVFIISRLGYRLMTGHLQKAEKDAQGGQIPMPSEVVHQS